MNEAEIKAYIDKAIAEKCAQQIPAYGTNTIFRPVLLKWFKDGIHSSFGYGKMGEVLPKSGYDCAVMWEQIRKIATKMTGASQVSTIRDPDKANRYADAICQLIYDLMMEEQNERIIS